MASEAHMDGSCSASGRIPRQRHPGAEQPFSIVLREGRIAHPRSGYKHAVRIGNEIRSSSRRLIPTAVEFVPETDLKREIGPQLNRVLNVPRAHQASPTE